MAGNIKVNTSELTAAKNTINQCNVSLNDNLKNAKEKIKGLEGNSYAGEACKALMAKIDDMEVAFKLYKEKIERVTDWIDKTVQSDESTERAEKENIASTIRNGSEFNFSN